MEENKWIAIFTNSKNNPKKQGVYKVLRDNKFEGTAVFYPPNCGGKTEENGTWYGTVTHYKLKQD